MIDPERIQPLNDAPVRRGRDVLCWMRAWQREHFNHALERAVKSGRGHDG